MNTEIDQEEFASAFEQWVLSAREIRKLWRNPKILQHAEYESIFEPLKNAAFHSIGIIFRDLSHGLRDFNSPIYLVEFNSLHSRYYFNFLGFSVMVSVTDHIFFDTDEDDDEDPSYLGNVFVAESDFCGIRERNVEIRISDLLNRRFVSGGVCVHSSEDEGSEDDINILGTSVGNNASFYLYQLSKVLEKRR